MGARENKFHTQQNEALHAHMKFYLCFHNSCEILNSFSWLP